MVQCRIACCTSSDRHKFNNENMVFFTVPVMRKKVVRYGKEGLYESKKNNVKICQHQAWMHAITKGYTNGRPECSHKNNMRICICHFHPSVIFKNSDGKYQLRTGASPTMCLTKFSMENDNFKEDTSLPRIVGNTEDLQIIYNHENNNNELSNDNKSAIVTPTRESRHNKRRFEFLELEKKTGLFRK